jgi:two-component system CitB family sensor kinase
VSTRSPARWSVATQTFALQVGVAVLVVAAGLAGAWVQAQRAGDIEAIARTTAVAETVAATPAVITAVQQPSPTTTLQPYAERVRVESGTDFVVIMSPEAIRFTHPDPSQIGKKFIGHTADALAGGTVVEDYTGTLGPSLRVVKPILDGGRVVALVSVGIRKSAVGEQVRAQLPGILLAGLVAAFLSGLGTALVARRIRRQTHGLGE